MPGQAIPGYLPGSILPQVAGQYDGGAPGCELAGDAIKMASRGARRTHCDRRGDSTPIADRPTRQRISRNCAVGLGLCGRWEGPGRVSITPRRRRSSSPSNMRCCPGIISAPGPRPALSSLPGARTCTTSNDGTAGGVAGSGRVRENRCHPAARSLNEASTIIRETQAAAWHACEFGRAFGRACWPDGHFAEHDAGVGFKDDVAWRGLDDADSLAFPGLGGPSPYRPSFGPVYSRTGRP